jgi:proton glutamate symport protein
MSMTARVLLGLALGLAGGIIGAATGHPALLALVPVVEPVGTLWLNGLRMTIVPLVFSLLVIGVGAMSDAAAAGRVGGRTLALIAGFLAAGALLGALATPTLLAWRPIAPETAAALRAGAGGAAEQTLSAPALGRWITGLVPVNPVQAAAEGAMLPLVVFALVFGFALTRLTSEPRERMLGFFRALAEAMMVIVHWVLYLAPIGVLALVYPVGISAGIEVVGALGYYVVLVSGLCVVATLALYPATALGAGIPVRRFAAAAAPAQAVAFSTRSSLAALPVMIESAESRLRLPPALAALVLPLAVALMRITAPLSIIVAAIFGAALYGIELTPAQIAAGAALSVVTSLGAVGLPGQISLVATTLPVFMVMSVPLEILALMLAVEVIPDTFATVGNVTGQLSLTAMVAGGSTVAVVEGATLPPVADVVLPQVAVAS